MAQRRHGVALSLPAVCGDTQLFEVGRRLDGHLHLRLGHTEHSHMQPAQALRSTVWCGAKQVVQTDAAGRGVVHGKHVLGWR